MKIFRLLPITIPAVIAVALIACTAVPETGRKRLSLFDAQGSKFTTAGLAQFQKYKQSRKISRNPRYTQPLARVAQRLTRVIDLPNAKWEFVVFVDSSPNAFALPGGKVGVHTGLFTVAQNEAQLAAVVGHEIGHVVAGHAAERMSHSTLTSIGGALLGAATQGSNSANSIAQAYGMGAKYGAILPFSRTHELEADKMGALYMARAGYDPREAATFWQGMANHAKKTGNARQAEFMSTHPVNSRRIAELNAFMPRAMSEWRQIGLSPASTAESGSLVLR